MSSYSYSAGNGECYHDDNGRMRFPTDQHLYGHIWDMVATDLAEDFHSNHDGSEASWPLEIRIYEDDVEVGRFEVERDYVPAFIVWEKRPPESVALSSSGTGEARSDEVTQRPAPCGEA